MIWNLNEERWNPQTTSSRTSNFALNFARSSTPCCQLRPAGRRCPGMFDRPGHAEFSGPAGPPSPPASYWERACSNTSGSRTTRPPPRTTQPTRPQSQAGRPHLPPPTSPSRRSLPPRHPRRPPPSLRQPRRLPSLLCRCRIPRRTGTPWSQQIRSPSPQMSGPAGAARRPSLSPSQCVSCAMASVNALIPRIFHSACPSAFSSLCVPRQRSPSW